MKTSQILQSKWALGIVLLLVLAMGAIQFTQWQKRRAIDHEVAELTNTQKQLESKNLELEESLKFFASDAYKEQIARQQLGLQKDGEIAIRMPNNIVQDKNIIQPLKISNPKKWWNYLFHNNIQQ